MSSCRGVVGQGSLVGASWVRVRGSGFVDQGLWVLGQGVVPCSPWCTRRGMPAQVFRSSDPYVEALRRCAIVFEIVSIALGVSATLFNQLICECRPLACCYSLCTRLPVPVPVAAAHFCACCCCLLLCLYLSCYFGFSVLVSICVGRQCARGYGSGCRAWYSL